MQRILSLALVTSLLGLSVFGHGDDRHFENKQDVTFKVTKVNGNVYMLQGRGGNIGAIVGPDGILIVDDDYRDLSQKLADALKELGQEKPRFILNTHWHGDHTQGNEFFGKQSIIVAHANVRKRLSQVNTIFGQTVQPYPSHAWPMVTYTESMSIHFGGDEVKAVHYPNGHTDGDSVVFFVKANVVHLGDHFMVGRFPFIDIDSGGSLQGWTNNIGSLVATLPADIKIIPGHGRLATRDDLKSIHQTVVETSKIVRDAMKKGRSLDEIKKAGLPEKYKEAGAGFIKTEQWVETIYKSYSKK